jgi:UDP-GlcNAc:undecaprenyl-phosphate GlcNAc-1-phosphate transferase
MILEKAILGGVSALALSLVFTPVVRLVARHYGFVAHPRGDRWHQHPTALFGGVGIFLSFIIPFSVLYDRHDLSILFLMAGSIIIVGLGIVDDLYRVQPYTKLLVQIGAAAVATFGAFVPAEGLAQILIPLAIFGLVVMTNAFNLLDNMDGLSAGIACIASFFLFLIAVTTQSWTVALCAALLVGATLGFLFYNFNPATIFMGDSGSMFLGFLLAALTMKGNWEQATNLLLMVLAPIMVLAVPIFDTTFVTLVRLMNGRAISQGGRDHTSHRLVAFGLSERKAVVLFYLMSIVCGCIAYWGVRYNALLPSLLGTLMVIGISYFGIFLNHIVTYGTEGEAKVQAAADRGVVLDIFLMHKRRIFEVILDTVLICLAYVSAFGIRFEGEIPEQHFRVLAQSLPVIIPLKLLVFGAFGLYRGMWKHLGIPDAIAIMKAVTLSSVLAVATMTMLFRFDLFPRTVFLIDWMALVLLVTGCRLLIRVIRDYLFSLSDITGKRVVIVGAGDAGVLALREFQNNSRLGYVPVGFFDDDPDKQGRKIHGVPVLGGRDRIFDMVQELRVDQIFIAMPSVRADLLSGIYKICESTGLPVTVMPSFVDMLQNGVTGHSAHRHHGSLMARGHERGEERTWN